MRIFLEERSVGDVGSVYRSTQMDFCCEDMRNAFFKNFIGQGYLPVVAATQPGLFIYNVTKRKYPCHETVTDSKRINFCPFCGSKIEIVLTKIEGEELKKERIDEVKRNMRSIEKELADLQKEWDRRKEELEEVEGAAETNTMEELDAI